MPQIPQYDAQNMLQRPQISDAVDPSDFGMRGQGWRELGNSLQNMGQTVSRLAKVEKVQRQQQEVDEYRNAVLQASLIAKDRTAKSPELMSDGRNRVEVYSKYLKDEVKKLDGNYKFTQEWSRRQGAIEKGKIYNDFIRDEFVQGRKDFFEYKNKMQEQAVKDWTNIVSEDPRKLDVVLRNATEQYSSMMDMESMDGEPLYSQKELQNRQDEVVTGLVETAIIGHTTRNAFNDAREVLRSSYGARISPERREELEKYIIQSNRTAISDEMRDQKFNAWSEDRERKKLTDGVTNAVLDLRLDGPMSDAFIKNEVAPTLKEAAKKGIVDPKVVSWLEKSKNEHKGDWNTRYFNESFAAINSAGKNEIPALKESIKAEMNKKDSEIAFSTGSQLLRYADSRMKELTSSSKKPDTTSYIRFIQAEFGMGLGEIITAQTRKEAARAEIHFKETLQRNPGMHPSVAARLAIKAVKGTDILTTLDTDVVQGIPLRMQKSLEGLNEAEVLQGIRLKDGAINKQQYNNMMAKIKQRRRRLEMFEKSREKLDTELDKIEREKLDKEMEALGLPQSSDSSNQGALDRLKSFLGVE